MADRSHSDARPSPSFQEGARWIGYAAGGAFQNIVMNGLLPRHCAYVVDQFFEGKSFEGIPVKRPDQLLQEDRDSAFILFTMSSKLFQELRAGLVELGFRKEKIVYYGDVFLEGMADRLQSFGLNIKPSHYEFVQTANALLGIDNHSSAMGSAILLSMHAQTRDLSGGLVELGVFRGGNAFSVCLANMFQGDSRTYYLIDGFEGFPELSAHDPSASAGMFRDTSFEDIKETFGHFPRAQVMKGYVPKILSDLPEQNYSVVYYDCDLHDPAEASLNYFWPRLLVGGYILIHDYLPKLNGFDGVRVAVDAFLKGRSDFEHTTVPETTHLILRKSS